MAASAPPSENEAEDFQELEEEEEEELITGVSSPRRRIVLSKNTCVLVIFLFVTIVSVAGVYFFLFHYLDQYDYPPTIHSRESVQEALYALIALTIVTPIGFVVLKFRITNLLIGLLYLFLLVICIIFPAKSITEACYSLARDTEFTIHQYAKNPFIDHKLHNFWAALQQNKQCCGTKEIDKIEDWPYFLNTTDFPASCCSSKSIMYAAKLGLLSEGKKGVKIDLSQTQQRHKPEVDKLVSYCGRGFARTRNRGVPYSYTNPMFRRVFSGFFLSLTEKQVEKMHSYFKRPVFHYKPEMVNAEMLDIVQRKIATLDTVTVFKRMWKNYYIDSVCNGWDDLKTGNSTTGNFPPADNEKYCTDKARDFDNDLAYPANMEHSTFVESIGVIKNVTAVNETCLREGANITAFRQGLNLSDFDPVVHCKKLVTKAKLNATTIGRELLLQLDYLTTYIYELGTTGKGSGIKIQRYEWMLWPIPTRFDASELYPYKLAANYLRVANTKDKSEDGKFKKMYYFSRGISENTVLDGLIHPKTCESLDADRLPSIKRKIARDLNRRWRRRKPFSDWKNKEEGLGVYFLREVHKTLYITIGVSVLCIVVVFGLAVFFWQYYSRIKAEEYANLALPKEFEVLHLRRGSLLDEADIAKPVIKKRRTRTFIRKRVGPGPGPATPAFWGPGARNVPPHAQQRRPVRGGPGVRPPFPQQWPPGHPQQHQLLQNPGMGRGQPLSGAAPFPQSPGMGRGQPPSGAAPNPSPRAPPSPGVTGPPPPEQKATT